MRNYIKIQRWHYCPKCLRYFDACEVIKKSDINAWFNISTCGIGCCRVELTPSKDPDMQECVLYDTKNKEIKEEV